MVFALTFYSDQQAKKFTYPVKYLYILEGLAHVLIEISRFTEDES